MSRRRRRFGREKISSQSTHLIKTGVEGDKFPKRLSGFLICRNSLDGNNKRIIDYAAMEALGYTRQQIDSSIRDGIKADPSLLPTELNFIIPANVSRDEDGDWDLKHICLDTHHCETIPDESKEPNQKGERPYMKLPVPFCISEDGYTARRLDIINGSPTRLKVDCVPVGASDAMADELCPYSVAGHCKPKIKLWVGLYTLRNDRPEPLVRSMGWAATYEFCTTSEYFGVNIEDVLTRAADMLDGKIAHLRGVLSISKRKRRKPDGNTVTGPVYTMTLDEQDISARYQQLYGGTMLGGVPHQMLTADLGPAEIEPESEAEKEVEPDVNATPEADAKKEWTEKITGADILNALCLYADALIDQGMTEIEAVNATTYLKSEDKEGNIRTFKVDSFDHFNGHENDKKKTRQLEMLHDKFISTGDKRYRILKEEER